MSESIFTGKKFIVVISAPSGAGKTSVIKGLLEADPGLRYAVSVTTRERRPGERDGRDYYFLSEEDFRRKIEAGEFAEWAEVHGALYGTLRREIDSRLAKGYNVLLDVDVQGAHSLKKCYPDGVYVFLIPPSMEILKQRLKVRGTEGKTALKIRLKNAIREISSFPDFGYLVINDKLEETIGKFRQIIGAESLKMKRQKDPKGLAEYFLNKT